MTYIIQARLVRICYNEKDYGEYFKQMIFPSIRNEHHINSESPLRQNQILEVNKIKVYDGDVPKYRYVTLHDTP